MLQSMGSQRVGHDLATEQQQIYFYETNYSKPPNPNGLKQQISVSLSLWVSFGRQFSFAFLQILVSILFQTIFERMYSKEPRKTESFLVAQAIKRLPAMSETACYVRDPGSIPGSGRSPGGGNGNFTFLAWRIPWTEKPSRLQSMGRK